MCGIVGFTWGDESLIEQMSNMLSHRGPDQGGTHVDQKVSLGHRRLSVIDLSERGRQPMTNEDGTVCVVYNGEIYNFQAIRAELKKKGHKFRSATDTEVIAHAWEEDGPACVHRFNGMFALAIWDANRRELFVARDRLGIKPVYYAILDGETPRLIFASEMKAILLCPELRRDIDPQALYAYLGFEFVPAPRTILQQVKKLPPGHHLLWRADGKLHIDRYWCMEMQAGKRSRAEYEAQLREGLEASVRRQIISDVPIGVFLSGGIDSSALVAMMSRCDVAPIASFSLDYADASFSETEYARHVAQQFGTQHHEIRIDPITPEVIEQACWSLDEPMTDLSAIPFYLLCKQVRREVTVCLSGEGGDELLAGYDRFKAAKMHRYFAHLPRWLRQKVIQRLVSRLTDRPQKKGAVNMLKRFIDGDALPAEGGHMRWQYFLLPALAESLLTPEARQRIVPDPFGPIRESVAGMRFEDSLARDLFVDTSFTLPNSLLMKADKMSMAHALEVRVPMLDHEFVELCATIPSDMKLQRMTTKAIFRTAMRGILPDRIAGRGKQGYSLPIKNWLRNELRSYMLDTLHSSPLIDEYVDRACLDRLIEEHLSMKANHNHLLWALINLAIWHELFVQRPVAQPQRTSMISRR